MPKSNLEKGAMQKLTTFLMFTGEQHGRAEEAMKFYVSLFRDSKIESVERYAPGEMKPEGTIKHATLTLHGQRFMAIDGGLAHPFTFTPAVSLFVECETEAELMELYRRLSDGGEILMKLDQYPFSQMFAWLNDRFGVSWQLNLAKPRAR